MQRPHDRGNPGLFEKQQGAARTREGTGGDSQRDEPNHEGLRRPRDLDIAGHSCKTTAGFDVLQVQRITRDSKEGRAETLEGYWNNADER